MTTAPQSPEVEERRVLAIPHGPERPRTIFGRIAAHPLTAVVAVFAASRLVLAAAGVVAVTLISEQPLSPASVLCHFDCGWYLDIVERGYTTESMWRPGASTFAFFPAYPLSIQIVQTFTGLSSLASAVLLSNALFLVALIYVYYYARLVGVSRRVGLLAVVLISCAPQTFVFSVPYSESLFVVLLAAAMFHTRREEFLAAGLAAALLSAARPNGVVFIVFPLLWIVRNHGWNAFLRPWQRPSMFLPVILAPIGIFAYWTYSFTVTGDAFAHVSTSAQGWGWRTAFPLDNVIHFLTDSHLSRFWILSSFTAFAASLLLLRYRMYEEFGLTSAMFLLFWTAQVPWSLLRFAIVLFPIWIGVAMLLARRPIWIALVCTGMGLLTGMLLVAWSVDNPIAT